MRPVTIASLILVIFMSAGQLPRGAEGKSGDATPLHLDRSFFMAMRRTSPVTRDSFLEERLGAVIIARGSVTAVAEKKMFDRSFRIILTDTAAEALGLKIVYHLYAREPGPAGLIPGSGMFEFSGRLAAYTPLATKRDHYILDVILEKGAVVIE